MSAPRQFSLGDRFHVHYQESDESRDYELEVVYLYDDGTVDVAEVTGPESPDIKDAWSILPHEWPKYWTLIDNPNNERSNQ